MNGGVFMPADKGYQDGIDYIMKLTPREKQVFYMLLEGMKAKDIAINASISVSGANYFIKRIYRKLNVNTKTELVLRYFELRQHKDKIESLHIRSTPTGACRQAQSPIS
jgi:DNA-binding CsgD family transcriptional regulator